MKTLEQRWIAWRARRAERRALRELGASVEPSDEIRAIDAKIAAWESQAASSLERDRTDFAQVAAWARPLVILRGTLDRSVFYALRHQAGKDRQEACERHGAASLHLPQAGAARAAHEAARAAQAALQPLPLPLREAHHFSIVAWKEASARLVPRLPGLAGLAVGWWIAQTYTDSSFSATLHSWGIGSGPRHAVRSETLRAMNFWLPLLAAAVASYAGSRIASAVRKRYAVTSAAE